VFLCCERAEEGGKAGGGGGGGEHAKWRAKEEGDGEGGAAGCPLILRLNNETGLRFSICRYESFVSMDLWLVMPLA
jgi:hypothetical protein